jgi:hypothetical protein
VVAPEENEMGCEHYWAIFDGSQEMKRLHFILFWTSMAPFDIIDRHEKRQHFS